MVYYFLIYLPRNLLSSNLNIPLYFMERKQPQSSNDFLRLLSVYENYKPTKITSVDLSKIAKKYGKDPSCLLEDLSKKYEYSIPASVAVSQVAKYRKLYDLPDKFSRLLPEAGEETVYDPIYDVSKASFDAEKVLQDRMLFATNTNLPSKDNMSRITNLVPTFEGHKPVMYNGKVVPKKNSNQVVHVFDQIAKSCAMVSAKSSSVTRPGGSSYQSSTEEPSTSETTPSVVHTPYQTLFNLMKSKTKLVVVHRRRNWLVTAVLG